LSTKPKFSFIIPIYNEEAVLENLVKRMNALTARIGEPCQILLIDDGSTDQSPALIEQIALTNPNYDCVFFSRNFGHQRAVSAGLDLAQGEAVMILDGDLQDPPELFFDFYEKISNGYDVVYGVRKKRKEGFMKKAAYFLFYRLLKKISDHPIPLDSGDFCMINKKALKVLTKMREENRFLRGMRSWVGFRQIGLEYDRDKRAAGESKYSISQLFKLAHDGIFNFSVFPVKILTYMGVICLSASVIYFISTIIRKIVFDDVPLGFTATLFMIILFGGVQLISLGIIGEYVQRTFFQVKDRPLYIISRRIRNGKEDEE
jgi:dolichol-phosphate mannosyltransferase